jgi:hypothetical protein
MFILWVEGFNFGTFNSREAAQQAGQSQGVYYTTEEIPANEIGCGLVVSDGFSDDEIKDRD